MQPRPLLYTSPALLPAKPTCTAQAVPDASITQPSHCQRACSHLDHLLEAGLASTPIKTAGPPGEIASVAPSLVSINLTHTLITHWDVISEVCRQLPHLERLFVSENPGMAPPVPGENGFEGCFLQLRDLFVCKMRFDWQDVRGGKQCRCNAFFHSFTALLQRSIQSTNPRPDPP